jgi:NitT/TauT family transport system substrate-binding protein
VAPQISLGVAKSKAAAYKSPADLKGLRIGVSAPGSSTNMLVNYLLAKGGLKPADVSIIGTGSGASAVAAVKSGQVEAMSNTDPVMTKLEREGDVVIVADTRSPEGTRAVFGGLMPAGSLYAPESFIKANPNTVQALANAMVRALKWLQKATPAQVAAAVPEAYLLGDRAVYMEALAKVRGAYSPDGLVPDEAAANMLRVLAAESPEVSAANIRLAQTYTNEFARRANQKYP